ncbi:MAG TPA: hypothetical protein PK402_01570 [Tepidisphaeraceae bacterium]|nr:hypothetical protein [Tepidisphaeraceae bacterium]
MDKTASQESHNEILSGVWRWRSPDVVVIFVASVLFLGFCIAKGWPPSRGAFILLFPFYALPVFLIVRAVKAHPINRRIDKNGIVDGERKLEWTEVESVNLEANLFGYVQFLVQEKGRANERPLWVDRPCRTKVAKRRAAAFLDDNPNISLDDSFYLRGPGTGDLTRIQGGWIDAR